MDVSDDIEMDGPGSGFLPAVYKINHVRNKYVLVRALLLQSTKFSDQNFEEEIGRVYTSLYCAGKASI